MQSDGTTAGRLTHKQRGHAKFSIHAFPVYLPRVSTRCIIVITWQLAIRFVASEFSSRRALPIFLRTCGARFAKINFVAASAIFPGEKKRVTVALHAFHSVERTTNNFVTNCIKLSGTRNVACRRPWVRGPIN